MHLALTSLKEGDARVGDLASRLGYQSEAAFSRAFKRFVGLSPGAVRRSADSASNAQRSARERLFTRLPSASSPLSSQNMTPPRSRRRT
jgi:AraC-like DNA-binding protein